MNASLCSTPDIFTRSLGSGTDLFEFSAQFDGPRITAKMTATIRAQSMSNLCESPMKARLSTEEPRRLSLQEQVDLILGWSSSRDEANGQRYPVENSYKEPQSCGKCDGKRTDFRNVPKHPRPRSASWKSSYFERSINDSFGTGDSAKSTDDDIRSTRASESIDFAESTARTCQQNLTSGIGNSAGVKMRPKLQHRQCSKIDERPEDGINHRSRSDPTSCRSKNPKMQTIAFV